METRSSPIKYTEVEKSDIGIKVYIKKNIPTKRKELLIYLKEVLNSVKFSLAYFRRRPEHIAINGRLSENIKEDIKEKPKMPSLSLKR
ncbi:hypothetical protein [Aequorivita sp. CIP111184]|uniref:hypothetical protein n=1 Tax=Aequorivita sp. CIP111184 TaxID=2211356 RepID=UPI0011BF5A8B|nr:hypothetical protein [Aequorivita sp. CIP111184]